MFNSFVTVFHLSSLYLFIKLICLLTVYLLIGVTAMTLTLSVIYNIPEFDLSTFFLLSCGSGKSGLNGMGASGSGTGNGSSSNPDPERIRLHSGGSSGPMYSTQQSDEKSGATLVRFFGQLLHIMTSQLVLCSSFAGQSIVFFLHFPLFVTFL